MNYVENFAGFIVDGEIQAVMRILQKLRNLETNEKIVLKNTIFAFLIKGGSLFLALFTTPAFIDYFENNSVLGVWYTLLSVLTWFLNFDLGIGNGIRNNLVEDLTKNDYNSARKTISSGIFSNFIVSIVLFLIGILLISNINLNSFYHIEPNIVSYQVLFWSTIIVFMGIMLRFFLTIVSSMFYALQKSSVNNFLALCVSVLQLIFVLTVRFDSSEKSLLGLSAAYLIISNLPLCIAGIIVFKKELKDCKPGIKFVDKEHIKRVLGIGSVFFICQILYMLIINTNEFLITNQFGPEYTTEYTFYYRLTSLISMLVTLAMTPIWSVVTKAVAEKNYSWLGKLYNKLKLIGLGTILLQFAFIFVQQFVMDIWLRENSIKINYFTAVAFACFGSVFVYSSILSTIVCGMSRIKLQAVCYGIGVAVKFIMVFGLSGVFNHWSLVVWSNIVILVPYCMAQQIDLNRYIRKLKGGKENVFI